MAQAVTRTAGFLFLLAIISPSAFAQSFEYDFDGVADSDPQPADPTDWMTSVNWSEGGFDPFDPLLPDHDTRVEIVTSTVGVNAPVIGPGDTAEAFGIRIGREEGEGLLIMNGGTLDLVNRCDMLPFTCNSRLRVGAAQTSVPALQNPGTFQLSGGTVTTDTLWVGSGSYGEMNMSGGVVSTRGDLSIDWTDDFGSVLNMTNGTINVATSAFAPNQALRMYRNSMLNIDGGEILINGRADLGIESASNSAGGVQTPNVTVTIDAGLLEADDSLLVNGSVTVGGGILRAGSFDEAASSGTIEINASGRLQLKNVNESTAAVQALINSGTINTSGASALMVEVVNVGGTDFTQVSLASAGLLGDFDGDTDVDGADFLDWQQGFPDTFNAANLDNWKSNFGTGVPLSGIRAVPEPGSLFLLVIGSVPWTWSKRFQR